MKKTLRLSLFSIVTVGLVATVFYNNSKAPEAKYKSRYVSADSPHGYAEFIHMLKADPKTGRVDIADVAAARNQVKSGAHYKTNALGLSWATQGPDNVGGRTRAFLIDKDDPSIMYMGSVSGGLFKSTTGGSSWFPIGDDLGSLIVASLCQTTNGDIYYSTGEAQFNLGNSPNGDRGSSFFGGGIYKSTDGTNFSLLPSTEPTSAFSDFGDIPWIKAHLTNPNILWAATNRGLKRTDDGGATWVDCITAKSSITDMTLASDGSMWLNLNGAAMYSPDGSVNSFTEISMNNAGPTDLPKSPGRMRIETAPSDPNYVYVTQIQGQGGSWLLSGIYRSTDRGNTWSKIGSHTNTWDPFGLPDFQGGFANGQGAYDLSMGVDPLDKNHLYAGGIDVWSWTPSGGWEVFTSAYSPINNYTHADNHHIVFDPNNPTKMYLLSDGGLFITSNRQTFTELNKNYNTIQFYDIGVGKNRELIGGSQDQRTQYNDRSGNTPEAARQVLSGDGGFSEISWLNNKVLLAETPNGSMVRSNNTGQSWENFRNTKMSNKGAAFIAPYRLYETTSDINSTDSVLFIATASGRSLGFGDGTKDTFDFIQPRPQASSIFIPETFFIYAGADTLKSDTQGNLTGNGVGTFNVTTGECKAVFNTPPTAEVVSSCLIRYDAGSEIIAKSKTNALPLRHTLVQSLNPLDTAKIQDPVQAFVVAGFNGSVWMTRDVLDFSKPATWWQIATVGGQPISLKIDDDGDVVYVGTSNGNAYQISNLSMARDSATMDISSLNIAAVTNKIGGSTFNGRAVTDFATDPNNPNRLILTLGNYNQSNYVYYSTNARSATPTFNAIDGTSLPNAPVYSAVIDKGNGQRLILGTEFGIYGTDNLGVSGTTFTQENNGFANVPVFALEQYRSNSDSYLENCREVNQGGTIVTICDTNWIQEGDIFLGAHGRGWYRTTDFMVTKPISVDENRIENNLAEEKNFLKIYPNPAIDFTKVEVELTGKGDVAVHVLDFNGRIVKTVKLNGMSKGKHEIRIDLSGVSSGSYIMSVNANGFAKTSSFIVTR